jgi:hypothetical protein
MGYGISADISSREKEFSYTTCPLTAERLQVMQLDTLMTQWPYELCVPQRISEMALPETDQYPY